MTEQVASGGTGWSVRAGSGAGPQHAHRGLRVLPSEPEPEPVAPEVRTGPPYFVFPAPQPEFAFAAPPVEPQGFVEEEEQVAAAAVVPRPRTLGGAGAMADGKWIAGVGWVSSDSPYFSGRRRPPKPLRRRR